MVFLVRNFWKNERPPSTGSSGYAESQSSWRTTVPGQSSDNPVPERENPLRNLELSNFQLKSENRKLQLDKIELEKQLIFAQSRNDQLEFESKLFDEKQMFQKT